MAALKMESQKDITVLINPEENGETKQGVYLTRRYKNGSGILPKEHIFISNNEKWFYWLGYYKKWQTEYKQTTENIDIEERIIDYINLMSSENQLIAAGINNIIGGY